MIYLVDITSEEELKVIESNYTNKGYAVMTDTEIPKQFPYLNAAIIIDAKHGLVEIKKTQRVSL